MSSAAELFYFFRTTTVGRNRDALVARVVVMPQIQSRASARFQSEARRKVALLDRPRSEISQRSGRQGIEDARWPLSDTGLAAELDVVRQRHSGAFAHVHYGPLGILIEVET